MCERRSAEQLFLLADARVERAHGFALLKIAVEQPLPFLFVGAVLAPVGSKEIAHSIVEFQKQEAVEQPVALAVGKRVHHIRLNLLFGPLYVLWAALVAQGYVAHGVGGKRGCGCLLSACGKGGEPERQNDKYG